MIGYTVGDATRPEGDGIRVICHCCNNVGGWGSGFVVAVSRRWKLPETAYRAWFKENASAAVIPLEGAQPGEPVTFELGNVIFVEAERDVWVANIIGQHETERTNPMPVRYDAIEEGLRTVAQFCLERSASAHMPRLGAGLAGGEWARLEEIVERTLVASGVKATVYDLPS